MGKIVSSVGRRSPSGRDRSPPPDALSLYAAGGTVGAGRKYLNRDERQRVIAAAARLERRAALFVLTLAWSGARISEILALTPRSFQIEQSLISIVTLKRRCWRVREVPIPPDLMKAIAEEFGLDAAQRDLGSGNVRVWPMSRTTAWRTVKRVMDSAGISGRSACPRGLRHAFGVGTLQAGVPITLLQRWLGHSRLSATAIYATAAGPEEVALASLFWKWAG